MKISTLAATTLGLSASILFPTGAFAQAPGEPANPMTPTNAVPELPIAVADEAAFFDLLDLNRPELGAVKRAVAIKDWTTAKTAWARHLAERTAPRWVWSRRDKAEIFAFLEANGGGLKRFIPAADKVLARQFTIQGVPYQLEKNLDWQLKQSEETHVLSRMAYWRDLGLAYWQTGDAKYASDFVWMLHDWLDDNPAPRDLSGAILPNTRWRTLETGIRVLNWWEAMQLFLNAPEFDAGAKYRMLKSLVEHARYLYEWSPQFRHGNWQVSEAGGLAIMGIMLPEAKDAKLWRERGFARLAEHMQRDVLPDGAHWELTPGYHAAVMRQYTQISQLCQLNGYAPPKLLSRHELMFDWLLKVSKPNRVTPAAGDTRGENIESDMAMGALLYGRADMKFLGAKEVPPAFVWLLGAEALGKYATIPARRPDFTSLALPNSGYLTMRSGWEKDDTYVLFDAAPGGAGHHHQDKLQVTLYAGRDLLIDPGIYAYDQPLSTSYFRKPEAHNVLLIDGHASPKSNEAKFNQQILAWQSTPQGDFASAVTEFDGFKHQRSVLWMKPGTFVIVDHVSGAGEHEVKRLFHFPFGEIVINGQDVRTTFPTGMNVAIQSADGASVEPSQGWIPTASAKAEPAPVAAYVSKGALPMTLITVVSPFSDPKSLPTIERVASADPKIARLKLIFADGQQNEIAVGSEPAPLQIGEAKSQGRALWVRRGNQENSVAAFDGSRRR